MGLIKAFKSALSSELADQYLEYFYCDSLSSDVLLTKGSKKNTKIYLQKKLLKLGLKKATSLQSSLLTKS